MAGTTIDSVHEFKYLGVILDRNLNFESQIKLIRQQISARMYILKKIRGTLSSKQAITRYKSSILPFFQ